MKRTIGVHVGEISSPVGSLFEQRGLCSPFSFIAYDSMTKPAPMTSAACLDKTWQKGFNHDKSCRC
jgi:hypothetical protein